MQLETLEIRKPVWFLPSGKSECVLGVIIDVDEQSHALLIQDLAEMRRHEFTFADGFFCDAILRLGSIDEVRSLVTRDDYVPHLYRACPETTAIIGLAVGHM